jgi:hypothetical protein
MRQGARGPEIRSWTSVQPIASNGGVRAGSNRKDRQIEIGSVMDEFTISGANILTTRNTSVTSQ